MKTVTTAIYGTHKYYDSLKHLFDREWYVLLCSYKKKPGDIETALI